MVIDTPSSQLWHHDVQKHQIYRGGLVIENTTTEARYRAFSTEVTPFRVSGELLVQPQHFLVPMAASSEMRGRVVDARSGDMLAGARVTLRGTELSALTNEQGRFRLDGLSEGTYLITAEFIGYAVRGDSISVGKSEIVEVEIRLPGAPMQEDRAVEILGRRPRRSAFKGSSFDP